MNFSSGLPETACGRGSTLAATSELRETLTCLLRQIGCRMLIDAPCGDLNWMVQVDLTGINYVGIDLDHRLDEARPKLPALRAVTAALVAMDLCEKGLHLPKGDVVLCRDFLQHLPMPLAMQVVRKIAASGAAWLLVTSFEVDGNADLETIGGFRKLNMRLAPFDLHPATCLQDCGRELLAVRLSAGSIGGHERDFCN